MLNLFSKKLNKKNHQLCVMRYALCEKGFTLAEMMIVIAIVGIFSTMTIVNFRGNEKSRDLNNQALLLLDGIKRMQTSSLSGKLIEGKTSMAYRFEIDECSSPPSVGCFYSLKASTTAGLIDIGPIVVLENSNIDIVNELDVNIGNNLIVEILPPRGKVVLSIDGVVIPTNEVIIKLEHIDDSSINKRIKINSISGRMDILR